jgi:hypothetical protein
LLCLASAPSIVLDSNLTGYMHFLTRQLQVNDLNSLFNFHLFISLYHLKKKLFRNKDTVNPRYGAHGLKHKFQF